MPGPSKQLKPTCKRCNIILILGENCKPSSFKHGTYYCRSCLASINKNERDRKIVELGAETIRRKEREHMDQWRKANPEKDLASQIKRYGISVEQLKQLEENQSSVCKLCGDPPGVNPRQKRLCIDHDHNTNKIRGLLCDKCNRALGMLGDSPATFARILLYLTGELGNQSAPFAEETLVSAIEDNFST